MGAKKYGSDAFGTWERDENSLPRYDLAPSRVPPNSHSLCHVVSTGHVYLLADHHGVMQLAAVRRTAPVCINASASHVASALYAQVGIEGEQRGLFVGALPEEQHPLMRWGVGYVQYSGELSFSCGKTASVTLDVFAPPSQTYFVVRLALENNGSDELRAQVKLVSDVNPAPASLFEPECGVFVKQSVAMLTDLHPELGDFFLAGADPWQAQANRQHLIVAADVRVAAGSTQTARFLFGFSRNCSLDWLTSQLESSSPEDIGQAWSDRLNAATVRCPELWLQEECLWDAGRLLAFTSEDLSPGNPVILPGGDSLFGPCSHAQHGVTGVPVRDVLALTLALTDWSPGLALSSLQAATACQGRDGRMAPVFGQHPPDGLEPARDRSDLEILLLLAWCEYINTRSDPDCLETVCPFCDGGEATVWDHLCRAYTWIRDELRQGAHGLIRMLAGDWSGYLNRVGVEDRGESVLNTAMASFSLHRFSELARHRDESRLADQVDEWNAQLRTSVGEAFDGRFFLRAYTDAGRPVGSLAERRVFTDVQAWAVLARCGTAQQRKQALEAVIQGKSDAPVPLMSTPYPVLPPEHVSTTACYPGEGENGGVSLPVAAWFIWALVLEGSREQALREWERIAIRRRAAEADGLSAGLLSNLASVASWYSGPLAGGAGLGDARAGMILPNAHAVAWQGFALRKIMS